MFRQSHSFKDRVVIITGAGGGIGQALARVFRADGARLALLDLDRQAMEPLASQLEALPLAVDVTDEEACARAMEEVVATLGGIDVLINNAGITHRSPFADTRTDVLRKVMEVNYFGAINCTRAALPSLTERRGRIVGISSVAGFAPLLARTGYAASKHAMHGFFDTLRSEVSHLGVSVTLICPSFTDTPIEHRALSGDGSTVRHGRHVVGRLASPDQIAIATHRGAARRRRLVLPTRTGRIAWWLTRLVPGVYERLMARTQAAELSPG